MTVVTPGVTCIFGQTYTGKSTLALAELQARERVRALIFDPSGSGALDGLPSLRDRRACKRFLGSEDSRGSWIRTVRFADPAEYEWLAGTATAWRGVVWVLDDGATLMELREVERMAHRVAVAGRHMGGGAGVELWFIGHRPVDAARKVRAQVMRVYSFRQQDPDDIKQLARWCGTEWADHVPHLADYEWLQWPDGRKGGRRALHKQRQKTGGSK